MTGSTTDLLIIGGGVNGAGIARDAAGRGLSVVLCEQADLAGATSSASSKLIHGGLRYLEHYEFRLVREALQEREVLLGIAPHIAWPMRFVLPHAPKQRPAWLVRLGLFLYDHIGGRRSLPGTTRLDLRRAPEGEPIQAAYRTGFAYSDCWVDDARLVVLNAVDARARGAKILTRTRCVSARRTEGRWQAVLQDVRTGQVQDVSARAVVNAAGPWVADVLNARAGLNSSKRPRLIKGSHIVVDRLYDGAHAYLLQNTDKRVIFIIPYQDRFSLIGTTDVPFDADPAQVAISPAETRYLCAAVSRYLRYPVTPGDVLHSYAGVRPLFDDAATDAAAVTRDYVLEMDHAAGQAPMLSVFGGKITTYRRLAEHALTHLLPHVPAPRPAPWTGSLPLPGGDLGGPFEPYLARFKADHPWLPDATAHRMVRAYGTVARRIVGGARSLGELGADLGAGLSEAELGYLVREEWAQEVDDVLWRRTKLGLELPPGECRALEQAMQAHRAAYA